MNTETLIPILAAVVVLVAASLIVFAVIRGQRSQKLRQKFGLEYEYTMEKVRDRRAVEEALAAREKRVSQLEITELDEEQKNRYHGEWIEIQSNFVDNPSKSVEAANQLVTEVMIARGFPVANFEQRAEDLSVLYPNLVSNYRRAYDIALRNKQDGTSTEELRQAMLYYHPLFEELLGISQGIEVEVKEKEIVTQ